MWRMRVVDAIIRDAINVAGDQLDFMDPDINWSLRYSGRGRDLPEGVFFHREYHIAVLTMGRIFHAYRAAVYLDQLEAALWFGQCKSADRDRYTCPPLPSPVQVGLNCTYLAQSPLGTSDAM